MTEQLKTEEHKTKSLQAHTRDILKIFSPALLLRLAWISGVFSTVVGALLIWNYCAHLSAAQMRDTQTLAAPLEQLSADPANEELKRHIRVLDQDLRVKYFKWRGFSERGAWLLACGLALFLLATRGVSAERNKNNLPQFLLAAKDDAGQTSAEQPEAQARWAVAVLGACFLGGIVFLLVAGGEKQVVAEAPPPLPPLGKGGRTTSAEPSPLGTAEARSALLPTLPPLGKGRRTAAPSETDYKKNWPRFRGPEGSGISPFAGAPVLWDGETGKNVLWKAAVPLPGFNSPIVWENRVFLTGADKHKREVYCFDAASGKILWRQTVATNVAEAPKVMDDTGFAAPSAATDGQRVYAIFATGDAACFDLQGQPQWTATLGTPENSYGHASSLITWRNLLLVQFDQGDPDESQARVLAFAGDTGKKVWETRRKVPASWSTPLIIGSGSRPQLITCANPWVISYAPDSGQEIWRAGCLGSDMAASPIFSGTLLYTANNNTMLAALRVDGRGDVTKSGVTWSAKDGLPDTCSPLCDGQRVFLLAMSTLTCYDAASGKKLYSHDFEHSFIASPSLAGNHLYLTDSTGQTFILETGNEYKEVGQAPLGEKVCASMAFQDGRIFIRGENNLYAIATKDKPPSEGAAK